ncbi:MAG: hypothetical protein Q4B52_04120 [Tissierellia bacterium]|nr:hypothetical protein [Tissierellia bacterium]
MISLIVVIAIDIKLLKEVDYALLATFVFFFIFVGNINHLGKLNEFIVAKINNREVMLSIILSQFISNVPTAMLLSNYTNNYNALIIGTNLGGLGTFIASMASVISLKQFVKEFNNLKIKYILYFLSFNFCFLFIIYSCYRFIY